MENKYYNKGLISIHMLGKDAKYDGDYSFRHHGPHGRGTAYFKDGDRFSGRFSKGYPTSGTYTFANGSYVYITISYKLFSNKSSYYTYYDMPAGFRNSTSNVRQTYSNGYYVGEFKNGKRDGIGKYVWNTGESCIGGWKENKKHGICRYIYANGDIDVDMYINGELKGTIRRIYNNSYDSSPSYDDDTYSYPSSDDDEPSWRDKLFDNVVDAYNRGDKEAALRDIHTLRYSGYDDDYSLEDGSNSYNLKDLEEELSDDCEDSE